MCIRFLSFCLILLLLPLTPAPALAGESDRGGGYGGTADDIVGLSNRTTRNIVKILTRDFDRCRRELKIYRWDCYRQVYRYAANQLNGRISYAEAQQALERVEETLDRAMARYRDPAQPVRRRLTQTFVPIKPEAIPEVRRQTERAMAEATTILLRAPEVKQTHYARIAEAINSNKVLLRSAMLLPHQLYRLALGWWQRTAT